MKMLMVLPPPPRPIKPLPERAIPEDPSWQGFVMPEVPTAEAPGTWIAEHAIECVLKEAISLGLSLQGTHSLILAALGQAGRSLSLDDVRDYLLAHTPA